MCSTEKGVFEVRHYGNWRGSVDEVQAGKMQLVLAGRVGTVKVASVSPSPLTC